MKIDAAVDSESLFSPTHPKPWHFSLLFLFFLCLFVDLGGGLHLRYFSLISLLLILVLMLVSKPKIAAVYISNPAILVLFVVWPLFSSLIGFFKQADTGLILQNILALLSFPFLVVFFLNFETNTIVRSFTSAATVLGVFVLIFWVMLYANSSMALSVAEYLSEREVGYFGIRELVGVSFPVVYFKATLFFVPAAIFFIRRARLFPALLLVAALMAATSKTGAVTAGLIVLIGIARRRPFFLLFLVIVGLMLIFLSPLGDKFKEIIFALSTDANTLETRVDHWDSLLALFAENPLDFLVGQGAGTMFYSSGADDFVNNIELDHLNSLRKFGAVWFFSFFVFVLGVVYASYKGDKTSIAIALAVTFVICGTNPVLLTLLFFSILAFAYGDLMRMDAVSRMYRPS